MSAKIDVTDSTLPKKCTINFVYLPANTGYVEFENLTTGYYDITDATSIEVNHGDKINVCGYAKPGYSTDLMVRNGKALFSYCDEIEVAEDLTYELGNLPYNHSISLTPTDINFGKQEVGYEAVAEKEIVLKNNTIDNYPIIVRTAENFDMSEIQCEGALVIRDQIILFDGSKCKFTVKPKDGLEVGSYNEKIEFIDNVFKPEITDTNTSYVPEDFEVLGSLNLSFEVEAEKDDTPKDDTPKDDTPKDDTPKTGDTNHIMFYGVISAASFGTLIYLNKKRNAIK